MAVRKTNTRKTSTRKTTKKPPSKSASKGMGNRMPISVAFRIFLLIVIIIAFFMLLPIIKNIKLNPKTAENEQQQEQPEILAPSSEGTNSNSKEQVAGSKERDKREEEKKPVVEKPAVPEQKEPEKKPQAEKPAAPAQPSSPQPSTAPVQPSTPPAKPVETRDRSIYLIQESAMAQVKVNRKLNVSDTPLKDSITALLAGPTADEKRRGMISLVPEGSRLISARVEGATAVLDFNQEFRYNPRGREGCDVQIKQIVWTATEFPNVKDVQFLIEGQRVDFLSEGVVIRNPIGR